MKKFFGIEQKLGDKAIPVIDIGTIVYAHRYLFSSASHSYLTYGTIGFGISLSF
jgi:hypothetical protein